MNFRRLHAVVVKELRQLLRDRLTAAMIFGIPTIQLLLFGFAINTDVRGLDAAVVDAANTTGSRALIAALGQSQVVTIRSVGADVVRAEMLMQRGQVSVLLVIPADFERRRDRGDPVLAQLVVDASDPSIQAAARQLTELPVAGTPRPARIAVLNRYNPERRSAVNTVPGLIGVILTMTMTLFTAVAIVRERERGNLEMLIATPLTPGELILGKVLPFVLIGLVQVTVVLGLGMAIFDVPVRGAITDLYVAALAYVIAALGLGVFLSTFARTQFQAMQMAFFTFLPQILMSGFMFPFAGMPRPAQWIGECLPLTHFVRLVRGIVLRGASLADLVTEIGILLLFAVLTLGAATLRFRKRLD